MPIKAGWKGCGYFIMRWREYHQNRFAQRRFALNGTGKRCGVHIRHLGVNDKNAESFERCCAVLQHLKSFGSRRSSFTDEAPIGELILNDSTAIEIVSHN